MVLELAKEKVSSMTQRSEAEEDKLISPMLALAGIDPDDIKISSAKFDGNTLHAELKARDWNRKIVVASSIPQLQCTYSFEVVQSEDEDKRARFAHRGTLDLRLTADSATFTLATQAEFHSIVDKIFNSAAGNSVDKTLEQAGLQAPEKLDVILPYHTRYAAWRFMPQEFLDRIEAFRFRGEFFRLGWPRGPALENQLDIAVSNLPKKQGESYEQTKEREKASLQRLKDRLRKLGITYQEKELFGMGVDKQFIISEKPGYDLMVKLEELAAWGVECEKSPKIPTANILIRGKVGRNSFREMEQYGGCVSSARDMTPDVYVAYVEGGRISVQSDAPYMYRQGKYNCTVRLKDATLEEAARLMSMRVFLHDSALCLQPKGKNEQVTVIPEKKD